jgi:hypothetical protein
MVIIYMLFTDDAACSNAQRTQSDINSFLATASSHHRRSNWRVLLLSRLTALLTTRTVIKTATAKDTTDITRNVEGEWKEDGEDKCKSSREDPSKDVPC